MEEGRLVEISSEEPRVVDFLLYIHDFLEEGRSFIVEIRSVGGRDLEFER
jgi:hypothetical protein